MGCVWRGGWGGVVVVWSGGSLVVGEGCGRAGSSGGWLCVFVLSVVLWVIVCGCGGRRGTRCSVLTSSKRQSARPEVESCI